MKYGDYFRSGLRNLRRQKLRTSLTVFAIVIGAVSVTVMLTLVTSAKGFLADQFSRSGESRRVVVRSKADVEDYYDAMNSGGSGSGVLLDDTIADAVAAVPGVEDAMPVSMPWMFAGMVVGDQKVDFDRTRLMAVEPGPALSYPVIAGRSLEDGDETSGIVITTGVANTLGYNKRYEALVGQQVTLVKRDDGPPGVESVSPTIVGVLEGEVLTRASLGLPDAVIIDGRDGDNMVITEETGFWEGILEPGEPVKEGEPVGRLWFPDTPGRPPTVMRAPRDGIVVVTRAIPVAEAGDSVFVLGQRCPSGSFNSRLSAASRCSAVRASNDAFVSTLWPWA